MRGRRQICRGGRVASNTLSAWGVKAEQDAVESRSEGSGHDLRCREFALESSSSVPLWRGMERL